MVLKGKIGEWHLRPDGLSVSMVEQLREWYPEISRTEILLRALALYYKQVSEERNNAPQQIMNTASVIIEQPQDSHEVEGDWYALIEEKLQRVIEKDEFVQSLILK